MNIIKSMEDIKQLPVDNVKNNPWKTVVTYAAIGFLWIAFSDQLILVVTDNPETISTYQTYKGIFYVVITAFLLYYFIRRDYARTIALTNDVIKSNEEIVAYTEELHAMEDTLKKNIKELHLTNSMLASQNQYVDEIYNRSNAAILMWHPNGKIVDFNDQFKNLLEYDDSELAELNWINELIPTQESESSTEKIKALLEAYRNENYERTLISKSGRYLTFIWNDALIKSPADGKPLILSFGMDITVQKEQEARLNHLLSFDELTGLGNKVNFEETIRDLISKKIDFSIYSIDFDNFRHLNEVHGFKTGDQFLTTYAQALAQNFNTFDCFRWSADEFYMVHSYTNPVQENKLLQSVINFSSQKWTLNDAEYKPTVSIGVVQYPTHGKDTTTLIKNLDIALNFAKNNGRNQIVFYDEIQHEKLELYSQVAFELGRAIEKGGFELFYQPIFNIQTQKMVGAEALIRWDNPFGVNTGEFITIAENTGQIKDIDYWVIDSVFKFIAQHNQIWAHQMMSINLSAQSFNSNEILEYLKKKISFYKINPAQITFEITEYSIISNLEFTKEMVGNLKNMSFNVALDDFGTQYSSLNYLGKLNLDHLKIDKSYTDLITLNPLDKKIVRHIINLASDIGLETVAEGIETDAQLDALKQMGCKMGQGYLLSRPIPAKDIIGLVEAQS